MLVTNPNIRWGSKRVRRRLKEIHNEKINPEEYCCSVCARRTSQPSPLPRPWDKSSYDRILLYHLNDETDLLTYSGLKPNVDRGRSARHDLMKQDMKVLVDAFLPQPTPSSACDPSHSQTITSTGSVTETAPEGRSHTGWETSSIADDSSSREASMDFARGSCQDDLRQPLSQLDTTTRAPKLVEEASGMGSIQISTDCTQHDSSQDAQFLRTPSRSHGHASSEATSIFTQDMRRSMSSCTGKSTLDPDDVSDQMQSAVDKSMPGPEIDVMGDQAADEDLQAAGRKDSTHKAETTQMGSSPNENLTMRKTWASLRRKFKAVCKRYGKVVRRKTEDMPS